MEYSETEPFERRISYEPLCLRMEKEQYWKKRSAEWTLKVRRRRGEEEPRRWVTKVNGVNLIPPCRVSI